MLYRNMFYWISLWLNFIMPRIHRFEMGQSNLNKIGQSNLNEMGQSNLNLNVWTCVSLFFVMRLLCMRLHHFLGRTAARFNNTRQCPFVAAWIDQTAPVNSPMLGVQDARCSSSCVDAARIHKLDGAVCYTVTLLTEESKCQKWFFFHFFE